MRKILIPLAFLFTLQGLYAADLQVYVDSSETYIGQPLQLTMQISSNKALKRPALGDINGFQITPAGESRYEQRTLGGGGNSRTVTMEYSWRLMPLNTGILRIPAFELDLEDGIVKSSEIEILVREPGPLEGYHLFLTVQGDTVFPGIPVRLSLKWLFSSEVSRPEFSLPFLSRDDLKVEDLSPPSSQSSDIYQFSVEGRTMYAEQSAEIFEGEQYASLTMNWNIYPEEEGFLNLEPVFISFQRTILNRQGRKSYAPAVIPSNDISLEVKELPGEMKNFPGGILVADDRLELEITLDQTRIYPGDPLELTLIMDGLSSPELTDFKGLSFSPELKGIVRVDRGSLVSELEGRKKTYTQKIRIESDKLNAFPSITVPYYNLKKGSVETAMSDEIPLTMLSLEDSYTGSDQGSSGFLNWNSNDLPGDEESIALKANHRIRISVFYSAVRGFSPLIVLLLFFFTILLLVLPSLLKGVSSIRFGRKEADIRVLLRKAAREYELHPDAVHGQTLHDLLLRWGEVREISADDKLWFQDLTLSLEQFLWDGDQKSEKSCLISDRVLKSVKDDLIKHLNKGRA
ncbi:MULTISPECIES: BatD family protein [unclassified Oceanispirochaeta]|uniref:BatD family protein n=1 Tax=unclassified Oceanispirochaeta TaxID=2635722 RepID=UPI000E09DE5F|nr:MULTISPECIES: BatD family protein [unclassified Oceanispirochaeta]RDG29303.1 hypothetical protein DV872_22455 [Oceanispirochaeta sp. M1]